MRIVSGESLQRRRRLLRRGRGRWGWGGYGKGGGGGQGSQCRGGLQGREGSRAVTPAPASPLYPRWGEGARRVMRVMREGKDGEKGEKGEKEIEQRAPCSSSRSSSSSPSPSFSTSTPNGEVEGDIRDDEDDKGEVEREPNGNLTLTLPLLSPLPLLVHLLHLHFHPCLARYLSQPTHLALHAVFSANLSSPHLPPLLIANWRPLKSSRRRLVPSWMVLLIGSQTVPRKICLEGDGGRKEGDVGRGRGVPGGQGGGETRTEGRVVSSHGVSRQLRYNNCRNGYSAELIAEMAMVQSFSQKRSTLKTRALAVGIIHVKQVLALSSFLHLPARIGQGLLHLCEHRMHIDQKRMRGGVPEHEDCSIKRKAHYIIGGMDDILLAVLIDKTTDSNKPLDLLKMNPMPYVPPLPFTRIYLMSEPLHITKSHSEVRDIGGTHSRGY
ncbi:hypothetical protein BDK51DRAFT_29324 [Blyttiomyces helicus]|uniref:Uncharacterized protein n=1 Tax=Blyttiomyces helicus TaxID=388810 RepID=A0A4P9W7I4_9FUNG|nr:hypothetical protein BDK51DRAFT_29324 [Blyttiomyces helicus]|eukprot:RKO88324.1 hypothetical protein BDK51DRAFT_29324 [Blyttiomyces helicus]